MLVNNIVADVVAILEQPQFCPAACLGRYAHPLFRRHKSVATTHDNQQWTLYFLRHALQVELLQLVEGILLVSRFVAVNVRFAAYQRPLLETINRAVRTTVRDGCLHPALESCCTYHIISTETDSHQTHA